MILSIKKEQAEKFFGGIKFSIEFQAILTKEEKDLINKYKVGSTVLLKETKKIIVEYEIIITIDNLIKGHKFIADSTEILHDYENHIVGACRKLISLIDELKKFGGTCYFKLTPDTIQEISHQEVQKLLNNK